MIKLIVVEDLLEVLRDPLRVVKLSVVRDLLMVLLDPLPFLVLVVWRRFVVGSSGPITICMVGGLLDGSSRSCDTLSRPVMDSVVLIWFSSWMLELHSLN